MGWFDAAPGMKHLTTILNDLIACAKIHKSPKVNADKFDSFILIVP